MRRWSLQWFRSGSFSPPPDLQSYCRHNSDADRVQGGGEVVWVIEDYAASASQEVSIHVGQQVELVETAAPNAEWCFVRVLSSEGNISSPVEGLVPVWCLKLASNMRNSSSKTSVENEDSATPSGDASPSNPYPPLPATKRRGTFRKWLSNPVRKLSHGRIDRAASDAAKTSAKKSVGTQNLKLLSGKEDMGNKSSSPGPPMKNLGDESVNEKVAVRPTCLPQKCRSLDLNSGAPVEEEEMCDVELPPPMKIQDHTFTQVPQPLSESSSERLIALPLQAPEGATSTDMASEIEQIVKERMEHHIENIDIHSASPSHQKEYNQEIENTDRQTIKDEPEGCVSDESAQNSEIERALQKRQFVLQELVETEIDYVRDLGNIVEGYMEYMKSPDAFVPEDLKNGKDKIVFGNIEAIYEWHRDFFMAELEKCLEESARLGLLFRRYERRLNMYVVYCQNKPKSEHIVSEYIETYFEEIRQKLGHKLQLPDLLIKPVQRIMKYQLLLKDILKYTEKANLKEEAQNLQKAVHIMHVVPKTANDMMNVGRLQGFDGKITAQGKLLLQGTLQITEPSTGGKTKERQVFLFEQIIIFSEAVGQKTQFSNPVYIYKNHLQVNKMSLEEQVEDNDPTKFGLKSKDPLQEGLKFIVQCPSQEVRDEWVDKIHNILETQLDFLRALQSPIAYQKELTKDMSAPELGCLWNPSLRKTLSHPAAAHHRTGKSVSTDLIGSSTTSKSLRHPNRDKKIRTHDVSVSESKKALPSGSCPKNNSQECSDSNILATSPSEKTLESAVLPSHGNGSPVSTLEGHRKHSFPLERRPNQSQLSPPKGKRNFFEGFRNTLRSKSKTDTNVTSANGGTGVSLCSSHSLDSAPPGRSEIRQELDVVKETGVARRWSETNSPRSDVSAFMKVITNYVAIQDDEISVSKGQCIELLSVNTVENRCLVATIPTESNYSVEGWLPLNVLSNVKETGEGRKWSFRLRKPSLKSERKLKNRLSLDESVMCATHSLMVAAPRTPQLEVSTTPLLHDSRIVFTEHLSNVCIPEEATTTLTCKVTSPIVQKVQWILPDGSSISTNADSSHLGFNDSWAVNGIFNKHDHVLTSRDHISCSYNSDGTCMLKISNCTVSDSGEYICVVISDVGCMSTSASVTVTGKPSTPGKPYVVERSGDTVCLQWSPPTYTGNSPLVAYTVEVSEVESESWKVAVAFGSASSQRIEDLVGGHSYLFRVIANNEFGISEPGAVSDVIHIPKTERHSYTIPNEAYSVRWKFDFKRNYRELSEIGRGRFSIVKKCLKKTQGTHEIVAAKFINKKYQTSEEVTKEFLLLRSLQNPQVIQAKDTYEGLHHYILILQLVPGNRLFDYVCQKPSYNETTVKTYVKQLLNVLHYLHSSNVVHLDIKPENLIVDIHCQPPILKLVDFGDARHLSSSSCCHPLLGNSEFTAPEIISGKETSKPTDMWSLGVLIYVFLSGVSPFLEESEEETCFNILNKDYSFPEMYFADITNSAKNIIMQLLVIESNARLSTEEALQSSWLMEEELSLVNFSTSRLASYVERRKHVQHNLRNHRTT